MINSIDDCVRTERRFVRTASSRMPLKHGLFEAIAYRDTVTKIEHIALLKGAPPFTTVQVRVHSECLTGEAFGSLRCDCAQQLEGSLQLIAREEQGCLIYLRGHEGRGIGLGNKIAAYRLQDGGLDTIEANTALGLPSDNRDFAAAAAILSDIGIERIILLTNSPQKEKALKDQGVEVAGTRSLIVSQNSETEAYLRVRKEKLSHVVHLAADAATTP